MEVKKLDIVRFAPKGKKNFYDAVITKVTAYFETNNISPYGNREMWMKTIAMLSLYFAPYSLIVSGLGASSSWLFLGLWFLMGLGMSGLGAAVMHDANHGSYSSSKKVNNFISYVLEVIGGYRATWRIQHNIFSIELYGFYSIYSNVIAGSINMYLVAVFIIYGYIFTSPRCKRGLVGG